MPANAVFKPDEDARLIAMRAKGVTVDQLVAAFPHYPPSRVKNRIYTLMKAGRLDRIAKLGPWTDAEITIIKRLRAEGMSWAEMNAALPGRSRSALHRQINSMITDGILTAQRGPRVVPRAPMQTEDALRVDALFTRAVHGGMNIQTLCEIFRISPRTVLNWRRRLGLPDTLRLEPVVTHRRCQGPCRTWQDIEVPYRVCDSCKNSDAWRLGGDMSVVGVREHG